MKKIQSWLFDTIEFTFFFDTTLITIEYNRASILIVIQIIALMELVIMILK